MPDWLWKPSLDADLLALRLTRQTPPPVFTFDEIKSKFNTFKRTYITLVELLRREGKSLDVLSPRIHSSLSKTLDEYEDFKFDADHLHRNGGSFTKRRLYIPGLPYKVARHIYTDADITELVTKLTWQIRIMNRKMDDMVLSYLIRVYKELQARPDGKNDDSGSPAQVLPRIQHFNGYFVQLDDDDRKISHLWDRVDRLSKRLIHTSPQAQLNVTPNESPPSQDEISAIMKLLKGRFNSTATPDITRFIDSVSLEDSSELASHSQTGLRKLLGDFPDFISRRRVYFRHEPRDKPNTSPPNRAGVDSAKLPHSGAEKAAFITIQPESFKFNLFALDIVSSEQRDIIVCVSEDKTFASLHYLPDNYITYPLTETRRVAPLTHDTEVTIGRKSPIHLVGSKMFAEKYGLGVYHFPLQLDMFAFQSALRGKLIRHAFDVDHVNSKRGCETKQQHLKLWSDIDDGNHMLSFFIKQKRVPDTYLEFPLNCFVPHPNPGYSDSNELRIYFQVRPKEAKNKRASTDSIPKISSLPESLSFKERLSFTKTRSGSSSHSHSPSLLSIFSTSRRPSDTSLSPSQSAGTVDPRSSTSSGSQEARVTTSTIVDSGAATSPLSDLVIHPDAAAMQYLDIKFSIPTDVKLFSDAFLGSTATNKTKKRQSLSRGNPTPKQSIPSKVHSDSIAISTVASRQTKSITRPPPVLERSSPSTVSSSEGLGISVGGAYRIPGVESNSLADQAFAFEEEILEDMPEDKPEDGPGTSELSVQAMPTSPVVSISPAFNSQVFRIRGVPIEYDAESLKRVLASELQTHPSNIHLRSLAATYSRPRTKTAIVLFETIPSAISSNTDKWGFWWKMTEGQKSNNIEIDTHFHGLTMLHAPREGSTHEIDICVVAGLGESAFESFEEKGHGGSYMWVLDLLQVYFGRARIMLYGCNRNSKRKDSGSLLKTMAEGLIDYINNLDDHNNTQGSDIYDDKRSNVPLIFIGHSIAGLVIKEALVMAAREQNEGQQEYGRFFKSVCGILFFGVPSQIMGPAALNTILKDQARFFSDLTDQGCMQALRNDFNAIIESEELHIQYFYETEQAILLIKDLKDNIWKSSGATMILVDQCSATNVPYSEPATAKNFHSVEKDHLWLVKWKAHDPEETMVVRVLKAMKTKALARQSNITPPLRLVDDFPYPVRMGTGHSKPSRRTTQSEGRRPSGYLSVSDFHVGWICAVGPEYVVALELLDQRLRAPHDLPEDDENSYSFGIIEGLRVVIAGLAKGRYGLISAAEAATHMQRSFKITIGLMVGIAGGAPSQKNDIRLGDVVVSIPKGQRGGVFRYDCGKTIQDREFAIEGSLNAPPNFMLTALNTLHTHHQADGHNIQKNIAKMLEKNQRLRSEHQKPRLSTDVLYKSSFTHVDNHQSCVDLCSKYRDEIVPRSKRNPKKDDPVIHFGLIASGDQLMKNALVRDALIEKEEVLCFETEAGGLMNRFPCLVIRGICDYSDTHKNDIWQGYAAATAGAYAKELLLLLAKQRTQEDAIPASEESQQYYY